MTIIIWKGRDIYIETECLHTKLLVLKLSSSDWIISVVLFSRSLIFSSAFSNLLLDPSITQFNPGCYKLIIIICKVTTKKIPFKIYRKGKKKGIKVAHYQTQSNQQNTKKSSNGGIEEQKSYKTYRKQLNSICKSFLISNHIKCKWVKLSY